MPPPTDAQRTQGALLESAIHDLKNPIAIVRMNLEWAKGQLGDAAPDVLDALDEARAATHTMQRLVEALLLASRIETGSVALKSDRIDLAAVARGASTALAAEIEERSVVVSVLGEAPEVTGDAPMLGVAVTAMLRLLVRRTPRGGTIELVVAADRGASLRATSGGEPLAAHERDFELHLCERIIAAHGGSFVHLAEEGARLGFAAKLPSPST